jgi:hypothetical protein
MKKGVSTAVIVTLILFVLAIFFALIVYFFIDFENTSKNPSNDVSDCSNMGLLIKNSSNPPCYMMDSMVVYLSKNSETVSAEKVEFNFEKNGNVVKTELKENINLDFSGPISEKVYVVEGFSDMPDKVNVVGIITKEGQEKRCTIGSFTGITQCY